MKSKKLNCYIVNRYIGVRPTRCNDSTIQRFNEF